MSIYGYDVPYYGFSDPAITRTLYGIPLMPEMDYDDDGYDRRRPPPAPTRSPAQPSSPLKHRHDGTSPLPLGMDWSLPPRVWDGRNSVWPHGSSTGWSYCVTIPSWTVLPSTRGSDSVVFFRVQVGIQSPEGITTTRGVLRRFNEFLKLYSELNEEFPKKNLPPAPPRRLLKMRSRTLLEERRCALENWLEKLLSDIDVSRTALMAIFLELEAAARSSFYESNQNESDANSIDCTVSPDQFPPNPEASLLRNSSSIASDFGNKSAYESSDLGTPRLERDNNAECDVKNASDKGVVSPILETATGGSREKVADELREDFAQRNLREPDKQKMQSRRDRNAIDIYSDDEMLVSSNLESDMDVIQNFSNESVESDVGSIGTSNFLSKNSLGDSHLEPSESFEGLPGDLVVVLPSDEHHKVNRVLSTMHQRLGTTKMDIEDLTARLNQEIVARQYLTTKVKDLEVELETSQRSKENLQQAVLAERERLTQMQWDMEELGRKCMEMELKLKTEQDVKIHAESMKASIIERNEILLKEWDDAKEQVKCLRKQHDEVELKSKSDVELLVKEVKSLRSSDSELKQELSKCLKEKNELEKENQRWDVRNAAKVKLLHECLVLHNRLQESSVNFLVEEKDRLVVDTPSKSHVTDLLAASDNQIGLLLAKAQLLAQNVEAGNGAKNQDDNSDSAQHTDEDLRIFLADIFTDNAKLRKQVNTVIRCSFSTPDKTINDVVQDDASSAESCSQQ